VHESVVVLDEFAVQRKIFCYACPPDQLIEAANYSSPIGDAAHGICAERRGKLVRMGGSPSANSYAMVIKPPMLLVGP
jgi:hypothetical protein